MTRSNPEAMLKAPVMVTSPLLASVSLWIAFLQFDYLQQ